jgi:DNA-binding transcriptional ArsR family regulator
MFKVNEYVWANGERLARIRGDPVTTALAHPTRRELYVLLSRSEEMSTVQLQNAINIDRYNLYHHLKKLAQLELVENHRDEGRARWWRKIKDVSLPELLHVREQPTQDTNLVPHPEASTSNIDFENEHIALDLSDSRAQVLAKEMLKEISDKFNLNIEIPWNFVPNQLILMRKKKED